MNNVAYFSEGERVLYLQLEEESRHTSPPALPFYSHQICMDL